MTAEKLKSDVPEAGLPKVDLARIEAELAAEGDELNPMLYDALDDHPNFLGLLASKVGEEELKEYIRHSNRYQAVAMQGSIFGDFVAIPESDDNLEGNGQRRRHEEGRLVDLKAAREAGVDPDHVLYFRATQPKGSPHPEYYWTSDLNEVRYGLERELGPNAKTAVILVSTLGRIAQNGGLIRDINDDGGVAVRQIGLAPFDQQTALITMPRDF